MRSLRVRCPACRWPSPGPPADNRRSRGSRSSSPRRPSSSTARRLLDRRAQRPALGAPREGRPRRSATSTSPSRSRSFHTDIAAAAEGRRRGAVLVRLRPRRAPAKKGTAVTTTLEQIDVIHRMVAALPGRRSRWPTAPTTSSASARRARSPRSSASRAATRSTTRSACCARYYTLGVRYMTLTHSEIARLGRLGDRRAEGERPVAVRRGGRARDEPPRHAGRPLARLAGHDEGAR